MAETQRKLGRAPRTRLTPLEAPSSREEEVREPVRAVPVRDSKGEVLTRKRKGNIDQFEIPKHRIPAGWTYEWKRQTVMGQPDPAYEVSLYENGWRPVPPDRHPEFMPMDWKGATIDRGGMRLYERPAHLTEEARMEDSEAARNAIRIRRQQMGETPAGTMPREHPSARRVTQVNQQYAPLPPGAIPEDE